MTSGGVVFGAVVFQPLKRLAPSRFAAFQECPLREAFRAAGAPRLLAPAGAAHLGSVMHKLMETVSTGAALTEAAAAEAFDHLVGEEEARMAASPQSRRAVPLSRSVADFHVRRLRAIHAAANAPARRAAAHQGAGGPPTGAEIWVATKDGDVGGFIDEVVNRTGGIVLRDFKTGMAAHRGSPQYARALVQLQLYAALYAEAWAVWPVELEVVPIGGAPLAELVDAGACSALLASAREALHSANAVLTGAGLLDVVARLAHPAPEACRYCDYRPLCAPYLAARGGDGEWPRDVAGVIVRRDALRNGTLLFGVQDGAVTAHIRGISSDPARHAALPLAVIGSTAGFFNLSGSREHHSYMEVQNTTIVSVV
jgi:hypothetical protein